MNKKNNSSNKSLAGLFYPDAVAVIGASRDKQKIGRQIFDNILRGGFAGPVYPINREGGRIAGHLAYRSISDVPVGKSKKVLAVIAIPAEFVLSEAEKCAARGIKNIIIISAGFKESGAAGKLREEKLSNLALKEGLRILGPNCLGLVSSPARLNATFSAAYSGLGRTVLLSQSGAIGSSALDWLREQNLTFRYFVSLGNKASLGENQIFEYLQQDKDIDLVVAYLEEVDDGQELMSLISRLAKKCPVAVLKAGTSQAGKQLAKSHTGSLAGSEQAVRAGLKRAGAIWLDSLAELFNLITLSASAERLNKIKNNQKLSIISNAGGLAVLTADAASHYGVSMGPSEDILGDADAQRYQAAINKALSDKSLNPLLILLTPQTATEPELTAQAIVKAAKRHPNKLILTSFVGGRAIEGAKKILAQNNIPVFDYPEEAIAIWSKIWFYKKEVSSLKPYNKPDKPLKNIIATADYLKSLKMLGHYGIPFIKTETYDPSRLKQYRYPAVLKLVGPADWHKTDRGGIVLNLRDSRELRAAASKLIKNNQLAIKKLGAYLVVQEQMASSQEIILGFKRDDSFGPIMLIGQGGIYTEIIKDLQITIADLDRQRAAELIRGLKIYPMLNGWRGRPKLTLAALEDALVNLSRLAQEHPEIRELDINPFFLNEKGGRVGDVRIII